MGYPYVVRDLKSGPMFAGSSVCRPGGQAQIGQVWARPRGSACMPRDIDFLLRMCGGDSLDYTMFLICTNILLPVFECRSSGYMYVFILVNHLHCAVFHPFPEC